MPEVSLRELCAQGWFAVSLARAAANDARGAARALSNAHGLRISDRIARRLGYDEWNHDPDVVA